MEFTNEIFFNKNLTANETVIITYTGKLYSEHSEYITIVYGYGNDWKETTNTPMKEIENGFEIAIDIKDYDTFNFCFKNNFDIWDNNYGFNYISPILPKKIIENTKITENTKVKNEIQEETQSEINVIIEDTFENTSKEEFDLKSEPESSTSSTLQPQHEILDQEQTKEPKNKNDDDNNTPSMDSNLDTSNNKSFTTSNEENEPTELEEEPENEVTENLNLSDDLEEENSKTTESFVQTSKENIENIFNTLLDSILEDTKQENLEINPENLDGFGLQSVDDIKEETNNTQDINNILNAIINENSESNETEIKETKFVSPTKPIYQAISELNKDYEEIKQISDEEIEVEAQNIVSGLPAIRTESNFIDSFLNVSYDFFKKIGNTCKKLGKLLKLKAQEYGIIKEK